ncbi:MAG: hypothetical protein LAT75_01565 [Candidatus Cyclonatronum sp.]|uniref:hypothetical protein n=1 Tax=Cyclonatronum sp. TaxID=3024185 RepID=UPI0025C579DA|nr:hypothetical protein [Cyclonatronum sp.]MCC5933131.1 hypothetical protein [Balneolales bacterium]MCH8485519.1 hypothetical protein [Cyclonatronum sp.]
MLYTPVSIIVGALITAEGLKLLIDEGRTNRFSNFVSAVELMWMLISLVYMFTEELYGIYLVMPAFFVAYVAAGFVSSLFMIRQFKSMEELEDFRVPKNYAIVSMIAGFLFSAVSMAIFAAG